MPVWKFESTGVYTVSSFYAVVNFRGAIPVFVPAIWKIHIPPRVHVFLWLLSKNKLLSRDNLNKRQQLSDLSCLFCSKAETWMHLVLLGYPITLPRNGLPVTGVFSATPTVGARFIHILPLVTC